MKTWKSRYYELEKQSKQLVQLIQLTEHALNQKQLCTFTESDYIQRTKSKLIEIIDEIYPNASIDIKAVLSEIRVNLEYKI